MLLNLDSHLRSLALVNAAWNERTFSQIISYVECSQFLREIDLSRSKITQQTWSSFLERIKDHSSLRKLNLSHNRLMEKQSFAPSDKDRAKGLDEAPFTKLNAHIMAQLIDMLEMNRNLIHLNLEYTGLPKKAVTSLVSNFRLSDTLLCVHLSGNIDTNEEFLAWVRQEIQTLPKPEQVPHIQSYISAKRTLEEMLRAQKRRRLRSQYSDLEKSYVEEEKKWRQIRDSLKLKNVAQQRRLHEQQGGLQIDQES